MKKRNVMTMALSLAMVGVIGVGSTLAYLTAKDGTLTNTFEFDQNGITLDQWENANNTEGAELGAEGEVKEIGKVNGQNKDENGHDYTNVIPGGTYVKDVNIDVNAAFETVVFVEVTTPADEGESAVTVDYSEITNKGWTAVSNQANTYYKVVAAAAMPETLDVFDHISISESYTGAENLGDVQIRVKAVQTLGLDGVDGELDVAAAFAACEYQA